MSKVVSTLPTIWEEDVYTVLRLVKRYVDFINNELIPAINDNADDITTLETDVANIKTQIQSISVEIDGISDTLEAYRLEFAEIKNGIDSINTKITTINSSIVTINQKITSISNNVSVLESATQALSADMTQVKSDVTQVKSDVTSLSGIISTQGNEIIAIKADIKNLQDYDGSITNTLGDLQSEFTGLNTKVNALENLKYEVVDTTDTWQIPSTDYNYYVTMNTPVDTLNILLPSHGPGLGIYKTQKIYITRFWQGESGNLVLMTSSGNMRPFKIGHDSATGTGATTITLPSGLTSNIWLGELTIVYKGGTTITDYAFVRFD